MGHDIAMEGLLSVNHPDVPQMLGWDPRVFFKHPPLNPLDQSKEAKKDKHADISSPSQFWCNSLVFSLMLSSLLCSYNSKGDSLGVEGLQPSAESHTLEGRDYDIVWQLPRSLHFRDFSEQL